MQGYYIRPHRIPTAVTVSALTPRRRVTAFGRKEVRLSRAMILGNWKSGIGPSRAYG